MEPNFNQKSLNPVVGLQSLQYYRLNDILHECISRFGLTSLANEIGIDKSALSRFKNGEGALPLADIEKLMDYCDVVLINKKRYRRLFYTIITLSEFLKESIGW